MSGMSRCALRVVDRARDQLLAGAGLAGDEHRALGRRHQLGALDHLLDRAAAADDAVVVEESRRPSAPAPNRYDRLSASFMGTPRTRAVSIELIAERREQRLTARDRLDMTVPIGMSNVAASPDTSDLAAPEGSAVRRKRGGNRSTPAR